MSAARQSRSPSPFGWLRRAWRAADSWRRIVFVDWKWSLFFSVIAVCALILGASIWELRADGVIPWESLSASAALKKGPDDVESQQEFQVLLAEATIAVSLAIYAFCRVVSTHPAMDPHYMRWLENSAWEPSRPLVMGPIGLVWQDALVVGGACLCAGPHPSSWVWPLEGFSFVFACAAVAPLWATGGRSHVYIALWLLGLACRSPTIAAGSLAASMIACSVVLFGLQRSLDSFPWKIGVQWSIHCDAMKKPKRNLNPAIIERRADAANSERLLGWPAAALLGPSRLNPISHRDAALLGALVGWWTYVIAWGIEDLFGGKASPDMNWLRSNFFLAIVGAALIRWWNFTRGHRSPLSFFGRLTLLRPVLPRFDVLFVAPLAAIAGGMAITYVVPAHWPVSNSICIGVGVGVSTYLATAIGPSFHAWRLTGGHALRPVASDNDASGVRPI